MNTASGSSGAASTRTIVQPASASARSYARCCARATIDVDRRPRQMRQLAADNRRRSLPG